MYVHALDHHPPPPGTGQASKAHRPNPMALRSGQASPRGAYANTYTTYVTGNMDNEVLPVLIMSMPRPINAAEHAHTTRTTHTTHTTHVQCPTPGMCLIHHKLQNFIHLGHRPQSVPPTYVMSNKRHGRWRGRQGCCLPATLTTITGKPRTWTWHWHDLLKEILTPRSGERSINSIDSINSISTRALGAFK
jgi:hypothetical protein